MGRPLNDKFFTHGVDGEGAAFTPGSKTGLQIFLTAASFTGGPTDKINAWIVRQRSPERYEVTDGSNTEVLRMYNARSEVPEGRCSLEVIPFDGGDPEYVRTITAHQVKTWDGNVYIWSHLQKGEAADAVGEVDFNPDLDQVTG